jgi:hypothetical protein
MHAARAYKPEYDEVSVVSTEVLEANVIALRGEVTELKTEFKEHRKSLPLPLHDSTATSRPPFPSYGPRSARSPPKPREPHRQQAERNVLGNGRADCRRHVRHHRRTCGGLVLIGATLVPQTHLLADAPERTTSFGTLRVISPEGMIAFKLQGLVNNPRRTQDLEDIRALLRANRETLNLSEVREYFRLFDRERLLDDLLHETP